MKYFEVNMSSKFNLNSRMGENTLRENGKEMIGLYRLWEWEVLNGGKRRGRGRQAETFALINDSLTC